MKTILHIDFNSYFATVEQQANPRLRGKPIGVTGGDRMKRTVIGAASVEAKQMGVRGGMTLWEAQKLCPSIILVKGDSDKYLETTKRFLNILKDYGPDLEVFSIDEVFLKLPDGKNETLSTLPVKLAIAKAEEIKIRIKKEIGEWMRVSIGISYNKLMAKLASNLKKPDGLVVISNPQEAIKILDQIALDEICGIGSRIKKRLFNMGIVNFYTLRQASKEVLQASFKSYGLTLWNMARGLDDSEITPFFEKEEVKSIGHRHTIDHDTSDSVQIKQLLIKLTELVSRRLRAKKLVGKTVSCWYRGAFDITSKPLYTHEGIKLHPGFSGGGMQVTIPYTCDGFEIFKAAFKAFNSVWTGEKIRMIGASISNLKPLTPQNLSLLPETYVQETIQKAIDQINNKFGEFTLQRGVLINSGVLKRRANPFLSDRRFKI